METNVTNNGNTVNSVKNNVGNNANNPVEVLAANSKRAMAIIAKQKAEAEKAAKEAGKAPKKDASAKKAEDKKADTKGKAGKAPKKEGTVTLASQLDSLILKGGKWETLIETANAAAKKLGATTKFSRGVLTAHINYRLLKNKLYLGNLKVTDAGVVSKGGKAKKAA